MGPKRLLVLCTFAAACLVFVSSLLSEINKEEQRVVFVQGSKASFSGAGEGWPAAHDISPVREGRFSGEPREGPAASGGGEVDTEREEEEEPEKEEHEKEEEEGGEEPEMEDHEHEQEQTQGSTSLVPVAFPRATSFPLPRSLEMEVNPKGGKPNAFVNLCVSDDYVFYTIVLFYMLAKVESHGVFAVMVHTVSQENRQLFESLGIQVFQSREIEADLPFAKGSEERDKMLFSKLRVWELDQFDKIVLVDSDVLVIHNIDELFDYPEYTASPLIYPSEKISFYTHVKGFFQKDRYLRARTKDKVVGKFGANSGLTVLKPSKQTYMEMMDSLKLVKKRLCCPSQEFLYHFFMERNQLTLLPFKYHYRMRKAIDPALRKKLDKTYKVYHFVERAKPWKVGEDKVRTKLAKKWWVFGRETEQMLLQKGLAIPSTKYPLNPVEGAPVEDPEAD